MMKSYQTIEARRHGEITVAALSYEPTSFDFLEVLCTDMVAAMDAHQTQHLVVSFASVSVVCSDSIGILLRVRQHILDRGGKLHLCCMNQNVRRVFTLLNLDGTLFKIFESEDDALASFE